MRIQKIHLSIWVKANQCQRPLLQISVSNSKFPNAFTTWTRQSWVAWISHLYMAALEILSHSFFRISGFAFGSVLPSETLKCAESITLFYGHETKGKSVLLCVYLGLAWVEQGKLSDKPDRLFNNSSYRDVSTRLILSTMWFDHIVWRWVNNSIATEFGAHHLL